MGLPADPAPAVPASLAAPSRGGHRKGKGKSGPSGPRIDPLSSIGRLLRQSLEAYVKFAEEAATLSRAMEVVSQKLRLVAPPPPGGERGPVHRALAANPGSHERLFARLVGRMEQFHAEAAALHTRFGAQHGAALSRCWAAAQLWLNRQEIGMLPRAEPGVVLAAGEVLAALATARDGMQEWRRGVSACRYLGAAAGGSSGSVELPGEPARIDATSVLKRAEEVLESPAVRASGRADASAT